MGQNLVIITLRITNTIGKHSFGKCDATLFLLSHPNAYLSILRTKGLVNVWQLETICVIWKRAFSERCTRNQNDLVMPCVITLVRPRNMIQYSSKIIFQSLINAYCRKLLFIDLSFRSINSKSLIFTVHWITKYIRQYHILINTAVVFEFSRLISVRSKLFVIVFILISEKLKSYNKCQKNAKYYQ